MDEFEVTVEDILKPCVGTSITAVHEDNYEVFLHLSDGQMISVRASEDGGFIIDVQTGLLH